MTKLFNMIGEIDPFSLTTTKQVITQREDLNQNLNAITLQLGTAVFRRDVWENSLQGLHKRRDSLITNGKIRTNIPQTIVLEEKTYTKNKKIFIEKYFKTKT